MPCLEAREKEQSLGVLHFWPRKIVGLGLDVPPSSLRGVFVNAVVRTHATSFSNSAYDYCIVVSSNPRYQLGNQLFVKVHKDSLRGFLFISNLKKHACASKRDVLELRTLQYIYFYASEQQRRNIEAKNHNLLCVCESLLYS
jgi:hypothetical protein